MVLLGIMALLFGLMAVFPTEGFEIGGIKLQFPTSEEFFNKADTGVSVSEIDFVELLIDTAIVLNVVDSSIIQQKLDSLQAAKKKFTVRRCIQSILKQLLQSFGKG